MGISPIETVTMPPKSQEASILKGNETQRPIHNQVSLQQSKEQQTDRDSRQTVKAKETQNNEYRYDAKEKGNNKHEKSPNQRKKEKKDSKEKTESRGLDGTTFDIRI